MQWDVAPEVRYTMSIDDQNIQVTFMDYSSTTVRTADASFSSDIFMRGLGRAVGIVLLYDITSLSSFEHITNQAYAYARMCNRYKAPRGGGNSCEYILVGNKFDLVENALEKRQVDPDMAEQWAQSQGIKHVEVSSHGLEGPHEAARILIKSIKRLRERERRHEQAEREQQRREDGGKNTVRSKIGDIVDKMKSNT
jgi:GTPase SAR1 family protein